MCEGRLQRRATDLLVTQHVQCPSARRQGTTQEVLCPASTSSSPGPVPSMPAGCAGYKSVAHYLVLTKLQGAGADAPPANAEHAAEAAPAAADCAPAKPVDQAPAADSAAANAAPEAANEGTPGGRPGASKAGRTRRGALRQTALTAVLPQTRGGGVAKPGAAKGKPAAKSKAAKALAAAVADGLAGALRGQPAPAADASCKLAVGVEPAARVRRSMRQAVAA